MYENSQSLFERAGRSIPGGVNSPVRAFRSVGGTPVFMKSASGAYLYDEDGNRYIDYINSWGPMVLGHAWGPVTEALREQLSLSLSYGTPTALETEMAELIRAMVPGIDLLRMVNSGTEACMSALRVARGYTGRNKFIKFDGCYHGHADPFLVQAGSGVATLGIAQVPGVPNSVSADTLVLPFNNAALVEEAVKAHPGEIAAIIVEPVAGNMGCIPPAEGYLEALRAICDREGIVLIFDEVMTGFRLAAGGAQELYGVRADLVTFGKIIGGGLPVGAFGGRQEIMECVAPLGKVYQAGTLSGNPLAMRAGYTVLRHLHDHPEIYTSLHTKTKTLSEGILKIFRDAHIPVQVNQLGSMMSVFFSNTPVTDFTSAKKAQADLFRKYFHFSLDNGVYLAPSPFESWFISDALSEEDIRHTLAVTQAFTQQNRG